MSFGDAEDMEKTYGNILSVVLLRNMSIIKKRYVIQPPACLRIKNVKTAYIDDFPAISKPDNPKIY